MSRHVGIGILLVLVHLGGARSLQAEEAHIAVASNFAATMERLITAFEASSPHDFTVSFASSGKLLAQIRNGAPFDAFLSADQAKPAALEDLGDIVPGSRFTYARGALTLWSADPELIDDRPAVLRSGDFHKLALANPRLAPYGAAAVDVLEQLGLREATADEWVRGENIAQTYQFVATGNATLGFVARSQLSDRTGSSEGSAWQVPASFHDPIRQDAVLLKRGADNSAARAFLTYLRQDMHARRIMEDFGYSLPAGNHQEKSAR